MKAQLATEFVILIAFGMVMLIIILIVISNSMQDAQREQNKEVAKNLLFNLQTEIFLANEVEEGYYREFEIREDLFGEENYSVYINNNLLFVLYREDIIYSALPKVLGNLTIGMNHINKTNGTVMINR